MEKVTEIMLVSDILEVDADIAEVFKRNGLNWDAQVLTAKV
jgi:hypothetical protein